MCGRPLTPPTPTPTGRHICQLINYISLTFLRLFTTSGNVTSPNYPESNYPDNLEKTETIKVEIGKVLRLEFTFFAVEWEPECQYDFVRITDGDGTILMNNSCGYSAIDPSEPNYFLPSIITTNTNNASIFLRTNNHRTEPGWSLSWTAMTPSLSS